MENLRTYVDTRNELKIVNLRKRLLLEKKEELFERFLGVKGISYEKEQSLSQNTQDSNVVAYLYAIEEEKQSNGKTIREELKILENEEKRLEKYISEMESNLENMQGLEYQLFYIIAILGKRPKKAVELLAQNNFMTERNAWRKYKEIAVLIKELRK